MQTELNIPDHAEACLTCAVRNADNTAGRELVEKTGAMSTTGVLAALFIAAKEELVEIVALTRAAITEQRKFCVLNPSTLPPTCVLQSHVKFNAAQLFEQ